MLVAFSKKEYVRIPAWTLLNGNIQGRYRDVKDRSFPPSKNDRQMVSWTQLVTYGIFFVVGMGAHYLYSLLTQKSKNLARKQDVAEIKREIGEVKDHFQEKSKYRERRRELYATFITSMRTFIAGSAVENRKGDLEAAYDELWLWGADSVVSSASELLQKNIDQAQEKSGGDQENLKDAYAVCIEEMRRDLSVSETELKAEDYVFAGFGDVGR